MAQLFVSPWTQYTDASGNPGSGDLLYFYQTGTTTPITIYSDSGLTTPQTNPVTADSAGQWAEVYYSEQLVKVVMKSAAGVTIRSADPAFINTIDNTIIGGTTPAAGNFTTITGSGATPLTLTYTDNGATGGPAIDLYRISTSPVLNDALGAIAFNGRDDGGNKTLYGFIQTLIQDPVNGSEDGTLNFGVMQAGTVTGILNMAGLSSSTTLSVPVTTNLLVLQGGSAASTGGQVMVYGSTHATKANDAEIWTSGTLRYNFDDSVAGHMWNQSSTVGPGNGNNTVGMGFSSAGTLGVSSSTTPLTVNKTADGSLVSFASGGTAQGTISVAGATVTYGAFNGSHQAQLAVESERERLSCGMILESVDEQSNWDGEPDRVLPKIKISDTPSSRRVYGVFFDWYDADPEDDTANGSALGAYVIRMAKGEKVTGGDLIESNGDGYGRVQSDDIFRSSTVAKITSTVVSETYPDGSYLVPCTLHCG